MGEGKGFQLGTIGALSLSVVSSVSIVICNKALMSSLGFTFATTLTSWHLLVTFCSLHIALSMKLFEHKPFDPSAVMGFGILNGISIGLLNLSLGFNSVGFYQREDWRLRPLSTDMIQYALYARDDSHYLLYIADCLALELRRETTDDRSFIFIPTPVGSSCIRHDRINLKLFQKVKDCKIKCFLNTVLTLISSRSIQISLGILLLGVGIATVTDLQLNSLGSILSLLAVITTCIAQIMTNTIQKRFKVSSTQLLYQSCPYQALTLFVTGPFLDGLLTNLNVFAFKYTVKVLVFIVLSCMISVSVNFSTFLVIGKTSPVTYQVLGHLKTCLVLTFGYALLRDPFSWRNLFGIFVALVGMILYSYFCTTENQQKAAEASTQLSQAEENESGPLISVENGTSIITDAVAPKATVWSSNKDLNA